jgi:hypothetical protein
MRRFSERTAKSTFALILAATGLVAAAAFAQVQNPIQAAKDAYNKARQQQQQQQKPQTQPQAAAPPANSPSQRAAQGATSAPITVDDLNQSAAAPSVPVTLDPKALPDVVGVHLGMPLRVAYAALQEAYPKLKITLNQSRMPTIDKPVINSFLTSTSEIGGNDITVGVLLPPNQQIVWTVTRSANAGTGTPMNRGSLLASLRQKYGKETYNNLDASGKRAGKDADITDMYWMYNEHGGRIPVPDPSFGQVGSDCMGVAHPTLAPGVGGNEDPTGLNNVGAFCTSTYVGVHANLMPHPNDPANLIQSFRLDIVDIPLAARAQKATIDWYRNIGNQQHQQEIERSKQVQPKF